MARKTYRLRVSSFAMGTLIMILLFLIGFAFVAGFYLGQNSSRPEGQVETKTIKKGSNEPEKNIAKNITKDKKVETIIPRPVIQPSKTTEKKKKTVKPTPVKPISKKIYPSITQPYYTLQVAALKNKTSATRLASSLRKRGYNVTIKMEGGLYKIRVGNFLTYDRANAERKKLIPVLRKLRVKVRTPREIIIRKII